jgi:synaptojanin
MQAFGQRIQITRPHASQPAFDRHFADLTEEYGPTHSINLLGTKENEASLTAEYARHMRAAQSIFGEDVGITHFDFHNAVRIGGHDGISRDLRQVMRLPSRWFRPLIGYSRRLEGVRENIDRFGFSMCDSTSDEIVTEQKGTFRTNCLDW